MKLYHELADWWPVMSPPSEYVEEAASYRNILHNAATTPIESVLELGSGGGNIASHLKAHFREMVLVDQSPHMLAVSRRLNPELEHHQGDMRSVRLGRQFDVVFVHDAICYMTTEADLRQLFATAHLHCRPGGLALFCPDYVRENFQPGTEHGGYDGHDRAMRWVEWRWDPDPADSSYVVDYAYLLRNASSGVRAEHDRHIEGLFAREEWLAWMRDAGFQAQMVPEPTGLETQTLEVFVGVA